MISSKLEENLKKKTEEENKKKTESLKNIKYGETKEQKSGNNNISDEMPKEENKKKNKLNIQNIILKMNNDSKAREDKRKENNKKNEGMTDTKNIKFDKTNYEDKLIKMREDNKRQNEAKKQIMLENESMISKNYISKDKKFSGEKIVAMEEERKQKEELRKQKIKENDFLSNLENKGKNKKIDVNEKINKMNKQKKSNDELLKQKIKEKDNMIKKEGLNLEKKDANKKLNEMNEENKLKNELHKKNIIEKDNMINIDGLNLEKIDANKKINEMNEEQQRKNASTSNPEKYEFGTKVKEAVIEINKNIQDNKSESESEDDEQPKSRIIPDPDKILEQNENITIYEYPNIRFTKQENGNCKTILMIGNSQDDLINILINILCNISFSDNIRYSINKNNDDNIKIYDIYSNNKKKVHNIKIISICNANQINDIFKENIINLFRDKIPRNKIHLVCFVFRENKIYLNENEKIFYKFIVNLFDLKDKLLFLISTKVENDNSNKNNKYSIHEFLNYNRFEFMSDENFKLSPEYLLINNKYIFENDENNWKNIEEKIQIIIDKLTSSGTILTEERKSIMELIFIYKEKNIIPKFSSFQNREKKIFIYYLIDRKKYLCEDSSDLSLRLINNTFKDESDVIYRTEQKINFFKNENISKYLYFFYVLSFDFNNLESAVITHCGMDDNETILLEQILTSKIKYLILNNNNIKDLTWLNKRQIYNNLSKLDLSFNNIENISFLSNCKFNNLRLLYLNSNKITNIESLKNNNFYSLEYLNLSDNEINSGIELFSSNFANISKELNLELISEGNQKILLFKYFLPNIEFKYIIEDKDVNDVLKNISFRGVQYLKLKGFDNDIFFLSNNTLKSLKEIDFIENNILDLSIFNNINFINLEKINIKSGSYISDYKCINKGFSSLNYFSKIYAKNLKIRYKDDKYECYVRFCNPELNVFFTNTDFLFNNSLLKVKELDIPISLFDVNGNANSLFSYETLKNRTLPFYKNIYSTKININYDKNKNLYKCYIELINPNLNSIFYFSDLHFFDDIDMFKNIENINLIDISDNIFEDIKFENFISPNLIRLENINIKNIKTISSLYKRNIICQKVECNSNLIEPLEDYDFTKVISDKKIKYIYPKFIEFYNDKLKYGYPNLAKVLEDYNYIKNDYNYLNVYDNPFCFHIKINEEIIKNINSLKNCINMDLSGFQFNENDLIFLKKDCFSSIIYLNLTNTNLKNINFITYDSLANLKRLYLNNNSIEDINLLKEENIKCKNLNILRLQNNPIRCGIETLKEKFFVDKCLYIKITSIIKKNDEFYLSLMFNNPLNKVNFNFYLDDIRALIDYNEKPKNGENESVSIYIDFYIKDLNNLWNIIDYEYTFFDLNSNYTSIKQLYNLNISIEELIEKEKIDKYFSLLLKNRENNFIYSLDMNEDNEIIKKVFKLAYKKGYNYIIELSEIDLFLCFDKIKFYYSFLNSDSLTNYNFERLSTLYEINLSNIEFNDINILCGNVPFINLKILNLSNNHIINLYQLKNAIFYDLEELNLKNDGIEDLNEIEISKYPFDKLVTLNLNDNNISAIEPIVHFKKLKYLYLKNNNIPTTSIMMIRECLLLRVCET